MAKSYVWLDGRFIDSEKAVVPISTHSLQYGSGIFEGIRAYSTAKGPAVFRLKEHAARFIRTAKIAGMQLNCSQKELEKAILEIVEKNKLLLAAVKLHSCNLCRSDESCCVFLKPEYCRAFCRLSDILYRMVR